MATTPTDIKKGRMLKTLKAVDGAVDRMNEITEQEKELFGEFYMMIGKAVIDGESVAKRDALLSMCQRIVAGREARTFEVDDMDLFALLWNVPVPDYPDE